MKSIRERIHTADEEEVIEAICRRYSHNRYLHKTVLRGKTRGVLEKLKSIPEGESEYILICYMGYIYVGPSEWEFSPTFEVIKKNDMENFSIIEKFEDICLWPGIGGTYFDDLNIVEVYGLGEIKTVPEPVDWNGNEITKYLNADFYPHPAFNDDELVMEFVDHYMQVMPLGSEEPKKKETNFFHMLEEKSELVKNRIARYQHLKLVYPQLRGE